MAIHGIGGKDDPVLETRVCRRPNVSRDGDNAYVLLAAVKKSSALLSTLQKPHGPGGQGDDTPLLSRMQHPPGASSRPRSCPQETVERPPLPGATPLVWVLCPWSFPVAQGPRCPALSALPALPALLRLRAAWAGLGWLLPAEGAGKCSLGKAVASQVLVSAVSWPRVSWRRGDGLSGQQSALKAPCVLHGTAPSCLLVSLILSFE
ncbi:PREDICTED: uncharacterized protein LOC101817572 [Ficedula albicollis]|uniref:uncharacterized protein LOC101817572 n=1 Tax=Ficedula albicollis TaxID=59894 RepID=UPI000359B8D4|nr:PREDICTED: uncharacterized protein LOC101817572 [Ficedula albicollis]